VTASRVDGNATWVTIAPPPHLLPLLVEKGCVAVDGISLTVVAVDDDAAGFTVSLIPFTRETTTAGGWVPGSAVNLEGDLVAKYVQRGIGAHLGEARAAALSTAA
jgi:riboflavin synthase